MRPTVLLRAEQRDTEQRTPITPKGAAALHEAGVDVVVESSPERVFSDDAYEAVGCPVVHAGSWLTAPPETVVVGIKELPDEPAELRHRHVYFAHAYKGQTGADDLLRRFVRGGGEVLDLEYLVDDTGRRVVAFGYWAGFVGASLGAMQAAGRLPVPLRPMHLDDLTGELEEVAEHLAGATAVVTGAWGRAGRGAVDALNQVWAGYDGAAGKPAAPGELKKHAPATSPSGASAPRSGSERSASFSKRGLPFQTRPTFIRPFAAAASFALHAATFAGSAVR